MPRRNGQLRPGLTLLGFLVLAAACGGTPFRGSTPTTSLATTAPLSPTASTRPTVTLLAAPSVTPRPTASPRPSVTRTPSPVPSSPTPSPTSIATKQVLLQLARDPPDGGGYLPISFGRAAPSRVLYIDGEFITVGNDGSYLETILSAPQMCALLRQVASTGFFQVDGTGALQEEDPIYRFQATPEAILGAGSWAIQINGNPAKIVSIYDPYEDFVTGPIRATLQLLKNYLPAGLKPYQPNRLMVWIDVGRQMYDGASDRFDGTPRATLAARAWPSDLPRLADWWSGVSLNQIFLQGDLAERVFDLHGTDSYGLFTDRGQEYSLFIETVLPHGVPDGDGYDYPHAAQTFDLPFRCGP
jgi:hypothetical protein